MIAEQSTSSVFLLTGDEPAVRIEMTLRMVVTPRGEGDACVLSKLGSYEPKLPEALQDELHQAYWDGAEDGLSVPEEGLPDCMMEIDLTRLVIVRPYLESISDSEDVTRLADTLRSLIAGTVASLWQSIKVLSKP
jgi:hypothetical protein